MRADPDIQFVPLPDRAPDPPPAWLEAIGRFLEMVFTPVAQALGTSWPVLKWVLLAIAIGLTVLVAWRLLDPFAGRRGHGRPPQEEWQPDRAQALALLEDADRLAGEGRYDEAVHLLLSRSVGQIAAARPGLVEPSSTARELAGHESLPAKARAAFEVIANGVERSLFALQSLGGEDWERARGAYSDFALERL